MNVIMIILGYLVVWIITARVSFAMKSHNYSFSEGRTPEQWRDDDVFVATVLGLIWPVVLGLTIAASPFLAVWWLVRRPTRAERHGGAS